MPLRETKKWRSTIVNSAARRFSGWRIHCRQNALFEKHSCRHRPFQRSSRLINAPLQLLAVEVGQMREEIKTSIAVVFYNSERECAFQTDFDDPSPNLPRASVIK